VPPPPDNGPKIIAPIGMPAVKTYPISNGPPPAGMSFPKLGSGGAAAPTGSAPNQDADAPQAASATAQPVIDDGFTPEQRRKNELEVDPGFKKYLMMRRMKMAHAIIRKKIRDDGGGYTPKDIDLFADPGEIAEADTMLF